MRGTVMRTKTNRPYYILDAEKRQKAHPKTFKIPSREVREKVEKGFYAKLVFETTPDDTGCNGERMWVEVVGKRRGRYSGILRNSPVFVRDLSPGESVEFGPENICSLSPPEKNAEAEA